MFDDEDRMEIDPADYPVGWGNTELEHFEVAHMACRAAWLWPEDHMRRAIAVVASDQCGVNYFERLEMIIRDLGADMPTARRELAEAFRHRADELYAEWAQEQRVAESKAARAQAWEDHRNGNR